MALGFHKIYFYEHKYSRNSLSDLNEIQSEFQ
jgi:hypothetical protein